MQKKIKIYIRSALLEPECCFVFTVRRVHAVTFLDLVPQVFMDSTRFISNFDLVKTWNPQQEVFVVNEALVLLKGLVVIPHLPIHAIEKGPFCKLERPQDFSCISLKRLQTSKLLILIY